MTLSSSFKTRAFWVYLVFLRSKISSKKRSGEESGRNHFVSFWKALPDLKLWISMSAWFSPVEKSTRETRNVSDSRIFGVLSQVPGSGSTWLWELAQVFILRKRTNSNLFWISCVQDWRCWTHGYWSFTFCCWFYLFEVSWLVQYFQENIRIHHATVFSIRVLGNMLSTQHQKESLLTFKYFHPTLPNTDRSPVGKAWSSHRFGAASNS